MNMGPIIVGKQNRILRRFHKAGARYYLDSERADSFVANRRKILLVVLLIAIATVFAILLAQ